MKELLAPLVFLALFIGIVGTSLYVTPKLAAWIDKKRSQGPYDDVKKEPEEEG